MYRGVSFLLGLALFTACSSGGGSDSTEAVRFEGLRVYHGAIDGEPISLSATLNDGTNYYLGKSSFGDKSLPLKIPDRIKILNLQRLSGGSLRQFTVTESFLNTPNPSILISALPGEEFSNVKLDTVFRPEIKEDEIGLRIANALSKTASIEIEISDLSSAKSLLRRTISFGELSEYIILKSPPSLTQLVIRRLVDRLIVASEVINLTTGKGFTLLVGGEAEYFVKVSSFQDF
jgi:hypothetical protein